MDKVYTLSDLNSMELAQYPLAVFGKPIAHSLSPLMQNAALVELAKTDAKFSAWRYYKFEIDPQDLPEALRAFHARNFQGINLTIPHKEIVFGHLENADDFARLAGAANTLLRAPTGWCGANTDGFGLAKAIENFSGRTFDSADVLVLGAGGAARAAVFYALLNGARSVQILNRTKLKAQCIIEEAQHAGFKNVGELSEIAPASIVINATSIGLKKDDAPVLDFRTLPKDCVFFDMPYIKNSETSSVLAARECGIVAASGLPMLAWQGAKSLSLWTGVPKIYGDLMLTALL